MAHLDAIDRADERHADDADEIGRQQADDEHRGEQAGKRDEEHLAAEAIDRRDAKQGRAVFEEEDDADGDDAGETILEVHGGLEFAALRGRVAIEHPGIERREEERGKKREQAERGEEHGAFRRCGDGGENTRRISIDESQVFRRAAGRREGDHERKHRHRGPGDGHPAKLDALAEQKRGGAEAGAMPSEAAAM
jgi:hypothetical protein